MQAPQLEGAEPLPSRSYVLLISGTMNPPHRGHVQLGLHAARALQKKGHKVLAVCFAPVHDNYLYNKVSLKKQSSHDPADALADTMCFPMTQRCEMLRSLVQTENASDKSLCHVLDYEHHHGANLLEESPGYWEPRLTDGYLKTVPTAGLMKHFASFGIQNLGLKTVSSDTRLGIVFGIDNLQGLVTWNRPGELLAQADLIFISRSMDSVELPKDPSELLRVLKHFDISEAVPVKFQGTTVLGDKAGSFVNKDAQGEGALFMLPALQGVSEHLSSTKMRDALATCVQSLSEHGFNASTVGGLIEGLTKGEETLGSIRKSADDREESCMKKIRI